MSAIVRAYATSVRANLLVELIDCTGQTIGSQEWRNASPAAPFEAKF